MSPFSIYEDDLIQIKHVQRIMCWYKKRQKNKDALFKTRKKLAR